MAMDMREGMQGRSEMNLSKSTSNIGKSTVAELSQQLTKQKVLYSDYQKILTKLFENENHKRLQNELNNTKISTAQRRKLETALATETRRLEEKAFKTAAIAYKNTWAKVSVSRKIELSKTLAEEEKRNRDSAKKQFETEMSLVYEKYKGITDGALKAKEEKERLEREFNTYMKASLKDEAEERAKVAKLEMTKEQQFIKGVESRAAAMQKRANVAKDNLQEQVKLYHEMEESGTFSEDELEAQKKQVKEARDQANLAQFKADITKTMVQSLDKALSGLSNSVKKAFDEAETVMSEYNASVSARLQGSGKDFRNILDLTVSNTAASPYVKTQEVLKAVKQASEQGIAYNIEQRAFLSTISEKIAQTFDAFDSNLTRLIRLQQADSTAARLGMEASLTKFFNNMFQDTSYLNEMSDMVSSAIIDANSQLDKSASAEFEYVVQKWLGSLSSLGMSSNAVSSIAEGINYLATGNVQALAGNNSLQTLFAMSSSRAGLNYSDLLLQGLNATNTNKLLQSMVTYLKEIAEGSPNKVVRGAYGDIFNLSASDFRAIQNLNTGDISNIYSSVLSYSNMMSELNNQFSQLTSRMTVSEMVSNVASNALFGLGKEMFESPAVYGMMKMLDAMDALGVNINIPAIGVMGNFVDLNTNVNSLMRLALGLSQSMSLLGNIMGSLSAGGGLSLEAWGGTETTQRGSTISGVLGTLLGGKSSSTYVSTGSSRDIKTSALSSATDEAQETAKITNKGLKAEKTFDDFYYAVVGDDASDFIKVKEVYLSQAYDDSNKWIKTFDSTVSTQLTMVFGSSSFFEHTLRVTDTAIDKYAEGNTLRVSDGGLSGVTAALQSVRDATNAQAVSKSSVQKVTIDEEIVKSAIIKAIQNTDNNTSLQEVLQSLKQGEITIKVIPDSAKSPKFDVNIVNTSTYSNIRV